MRAATLDYDERRLIERDIPMPAIESDHEVLFRIREAGICGTDRELARFRFGRPPQGCPYLVLGHEALGEVVAVGAAVRTLTPGDLVAPAIRRPCRPPCALCARHRSDLCVSGGYRERGIFGLHGYLCEYAVDAEQYLYRVPAQVAEFAVLTEPLSVVEKAVATALRLREEPAAAALVLGAGPIGLLAALVLRLRGIEATVQSLEAPGHPRAQLVEDAGLRYVQSGKARGPRVPHLRVDIAIEAAGSAEASFAAVRSLAPLGVCVLLGASEGHGEISFTDLVTRNQRIAGSVNASPASFKAAIEDLPLLDAGTLRSLIERVPFAEFPRTIATGVEMGSAKLVHVLRP